MGNLIDLTGRVYGRLKVKSRAEANDSCNRPMWLCLCKCSAKTVVRGASLRSKSTQSCGCLQRYRAHGHPRTHGLATKGKPDIIYKMYHNAKTRAKVNGLDFKLALTDIVIPSVCPILGIKLYRHNKSPRDNSPSLDRKNPNRGYVKNNVHVVSYKANTMKSNATPKELLKFAKWVLKTYGSKTKASRVPRRNS